MTPLVDVTPASTTEIVAHVPLTCQQQKAQKQQPDGCRTQLRPLTGLTFGSQFSTPDSVLTCTDLDFNFLRVRTGLSLLVLHQNFHFIESRPHVLHEPQDGRRIYRQLQGNEMKNKYKQYKH